MLEQLVVGPLELYATIARNLQEHARRTIAQEDPDLSIVRQYVGFITDYYDEMMMEHSGLDAFECDTAVLNRCLGLLLVDNYTLKGFMALQVPDDLRKSTSDYLVSCGELYGISRPFGRVAEKKAL